MNHNAFLHSIIDSVFYENIEANAPGPELAEIAERHLPMEDGWSLRVGGYWTFVGNEASKELVQGWKIHLSASRKNARELLERIVPIVKRHRVSFKFLSDENVVEISLNKNTARTAAGKFITVYPETLESFKALIEEIHQATCQFRGPFLLTDRPYKDSKVVFYRYGEHYGNERVDPEGHRLAGIQDPEGNWVSDRRRAFFYLPSWIEDPFDGWEPVEPPSDGSVMLKGRYKVEEALRFHAAGAIYRGVDLETDQEVVIREARPIYRSEDDEEEGFRLLEKEARVLRKLGPLGVSPRFVDLFQEWEHRFLVQERVKAESLWGYAVEFSNGSKTLRPADTFKGFQETFLKLARALQKAHEQGIVLRDVSRANTLITEETEEVRLIDFEFAYELDRDDPLVAGYTEGYSSPEQMRNEPPHPCQDVYSLGALIVDMLAFTAPGLLLNPKGILDAFRMTVEDMHLPLELYELAAGALDPDPKKRWTLDRIIRAIEAIEPPTADEPLVPVGDRPPARSAPAPELVTQIDGTVQGLATFIEHHTTLDRHDRLWPGSPEIFATNPVQLGYGAAGTAVFLARARGHVAPEVLDWMADNLDLEHTAPGLFTGLSGIGLAFMELGRRDLAVEIMAAANQSPIRLEKAELRAGAAGWGLANLHFFRQLEDERFLDQAREAGRHLLRTQKLDADGGYWEHEDSIALGYGHGQSGIATFLIYLDAVSPGDGFLDAAVRAVDFEIAHREQIDDEVLWFPTVDAAPHDPKSPHMRHGSAGVGTAVLRAWAATGEERFRRFADVCALSVAHRLTNKLWHDYGLAGYGEYLLDMYDFTGDDNYRNNAFYLAEGILPYRLERDGGIAFPAEGLLRVTTDFSAGTAGIGIFLHRLVHPGTPRFLMLDDLLLEQRSHKTEAVGEAAQDLIDSVVPMSAAKSHGAASA